MTTSDLIDPMTDDNVNGNIIVDYVHVEDDDVKPASFVDILKKSMNPNLESEEKMKKPIRSINANKCCVSAGRNIMSNNNHAARFAVRAAEKRLWEAKSTRDAKRRSLEFEEAACKEAKYLYEGAVSDEKALRTLLKAKHVEISVAQSEFKRLRSSGGGKGETFLLADSLKSIQDVLRSSGIGIHDLDSAELADELLKPMKEEVVSLKEDIQKAEGFTKASKRNYDNRTEKLKVLKAQLRDAEAVFEEVNREIMRLQNKDITEENGDIIIAEDEAKNPDLPCKGQMDLGHQDNESCREHIGTDSEKTVEEKNTCIDQNQTSELEVGCHPVEASVSEHGLDIKEVDDAGEGDLVEVAKNIDGVKKVEFSEELVTKNEIDNGTPAPADPLSMFDKIKKPNKRERRALAKAALQAQKEKRDGEYEEVCIEQTVVDPHSSNTKHEHGYYSEQAEVSEQVSKKVELDDDGVLSEGAFSEEKLEMVELSETEIEEEEEETTDDDRRNHQPRKKHRNKKKQKKLARKAAKARAAELKALKGEETETLAHRLGVRLFSVMRLRQVSVAISLMFMLLMLWSAL